MALAQAIDVRDVGERRWAEWWALPSHDLELGAALLAVFDAWDGDDSMVTWSVHEQFKALDHRLMAYEDWCADLGIEPARRVRSLRAVEAEHEEVGRLCGDCHGSAIIVDDDGSVSGEVGTLIDCGMHVRALHGVGRARGLLGGAGAGADHQRAPGGADGRVPGALLRHRHRPGLVPDLRRLRGRIPR